MLLTAYLIIMNEWLDNDNKYLSRKHNKMILTFPWNLRETP